MPKRTRDHQSWLVEKLTDPARASDYLNAAHEDSREMFLEALRDVAQAHQMSKVAKGAGVTRESLYRATSEIGNPTLETFESVLNVLGLSFKIEVARAVEDQLALESGNQIQQDSPRTVVLEQLFYRPDKIVSPVAQFEFVEEAPLGLVVYEAQRKGIYDRPN